MKNKLDSKILLLDIETKPTLAYVWRLFDQNVGINQIVEPGGTICIGAKWVGSKEKFFFSEWGLGWEGMVKGIYELVSEADAIVTYNGDKFDMPKLRGDFLHAGLRPPPPHTSIDVYKTVRGLGLVSGKLDFVGPYLKLGQKIKHEGFSLWTKTMDGDPKAQARMERYCLQDVVLLEKVYKKLRPYIKTHPHLGSKPHACGACGSQHQQSRGTRRTKHYAVQRLQCVDCGSWGEGTRTKLTGKPKK